MTHRFPRRLILFTLSLLGLALAAALVRPAATQAQVGAQGGTVTNCANDSEFRTLVATGGLVSFNCGPDPVTITLASQITVTQNTLVNGGSRITLDGGGRTRLFDVTAGVLSLQNIALRNGSALDGGGAVSVAVGAELDAVSAKFILNTANPQIGLGLGGAIYALGSVRLQNTDFITNSAGFGNGGALYAGGLVSIQGGQFTGNTLGGGNGGAIYLDAAGSLGAVNTRFINNQTGLSSVDYAGAVYSAGGPMNVVGSVFSGNSAGGYGGAISTSGPLTVTSSSFNQNSSSFGGGGVYAYEAARVAGQTGPTVIISDTLFLGNSGGNGGGLNLGAEAEVRASRFISNTASTGGGLFAAGSSATFPVSLDRTLFVSNTATAGGGGGVYVSFGITATLDNVILDANRAESSGAGGGLYNGAATIIKNSAVIYNSAWGGGGLYNSPDSGAPNLGLFNSTVSGNDGLSGGAGGLENSGWAVISSTTFANNIVADFAGGAAIANDTFASYIPRVELLNSLLATDPYAPALVNCSFGNGAIQSNGHNLDTDTSCLGNPPAGAGDLVNTDPRLQPLKNNGGGTPTHALPPTSPAIGAGAGCPTLDQRGFPRGGARCDAGAFQLLDDPRVNLPATPPDTPVTGTIT
ncbi:MAG: hypothetical protein KA764_10725, partial [Anaerolineales bacterium]|nr:hypothetical protein [Anaerolineales bacterium]